MIEIIQTEDNFSTKNKIQEIFGDMPKDTGNSPGTLMKLLSEDKGFFYAFSQNFSQRLLTKTK